MESRNELLARYFLRYAVGKLEQLAGRILVATDALPDEVFWRQPNEASNSVAQLMLHLAGNIRQWVLATIVGEPDVRDRDAEFAAAPTEALTRAMVRERFETAVREVAAALRGLEAGRLTEMVSQQGYTVSVVEDVFHVVEHFSYHAGQIFLLTKLATNEDLGFYRHLSQHHAEDIP